MEEEYTYLNFAVPVNFIPTRLESCGKQWRKERFA